MADVSALWEKSCRDIQEVVVNQRRMIEKINREAAEAIARIRAEVKQAIQLVLEKSIKL